MKKNYKCLLVGKENFNVLVPAFPGFYSSGTSVENALASATEGLELHIKGLLEDNESIPEKETKLQLKNLLDDCKNDDVTYDSIAVDIPQNNKRCVTIISRTRILTSSNSKKKKNYKKHNDVPVISNLVKK